MSDDLNASDDLNVNSLSRFRKQSSRLVLETHSSCEVPAGCGGVVLRWVNPSDGWNVAFSSVGSFEKVEVYVDGNQIPSSRTRLSFCDHLLALEIQSELRNGFLIWATSRDTPSNDDAQRCLQHVSTQADGTWLYSTTFKAGWTELEFDDSDWRPLQAVNVDPDRLPSNKRYLFQRLSFFGITSVGLPAAGPIFVRKRFTIQAS